MSDIAARPLDPPKRTAKQHLTSVLYLAVAAVALIGLADSIYLTVQHLTGGTVDCIAFTDCETVLNSDYAAIGRIPLAFFGALGYFSVFSLATLAFFDRRWTRSLLVCVVAAMLGVTLWLLYLQAFILHAFCGFCLLSAFLTGLLAAFQVALLFLQNSGKTKGG